MLLFLADISQTKCKVDKGTSHFILIYFIVNRNLQDMMLMTFCRCAKGADQSFSSWQIKNFKAAFFFYYSSLISREEPFGWLVEWLRGIWASKLLGEVIQSGSNDALSVAKYFFYSFTTEEAMLERRGSPGKVTQGPINENKWKKNLKLVPKLSRQHYSLSPQRHQTYFDHFFGGQACKPFKRP